MLELACEKSYSQFSAIMEMPLNGQKTFTKEIMLIILVGLQALLYVVGLGERCHSNSCSSELGAQGWYWLPEQNFSIQVWASF